MTNKTKLFTNDKGVTFLVRLLLKGDKYGLNMCLTHDLDMPQVEFYDTRHKDEDFPDGQFVSRYYLDTLQNKDGFTSTSCTERGLDLLTCEPSWKIDAATMKLIMAWLDEVAPLYE